MKEFIKEYIRLIANTTILLILMVASFYIFINYYHAKEISQRIYVGTGDVNTLNYKSTLEEINTNLNNFSSKRVQDRELTNLYVKLLSCNNLLKSNETLNTIEENKYLNVLDVYNLGTKLQSDLLNACWALNLSYLNEVEKDSVFYDIAPYITENMETLFNQTDFALLEIQNNSSYFYTTSITSSTIRNSLLADYSIIADSYNSFADNILLLSKYINEKASETGGSNNE